MEHSRRDVIHLFSARSVRLFVYGALSVVLELYLFELTLTGALIGLLFTLYNLAGSLAATCGARFSGFCPKPHKLRALRTCIMPHLVAGGLKIVFDFLLYRSFSKAEVRRGVIRLFHRREQAGGSWTQYALAHLLA